MQLHTAPPASRPADLVERANHNRKVESRADRRMREGLAARAAARGVLDAQATRLLAQMNHADGGVRTRAIIGLRLLEEREKAKRQEAEEAAALSETISLARARGETMEVSKRGPVMARSRDVLKALWKGGALSPRQYRAGDVYQRLMEMADPLRGLSPPSFEAQGGAGVSDTFAERVEKAKGELFAADRLLSSLGDGSRVILAVGWVAGSNRPVAALASSGHQRQVYSDALGRGLDALADKWKVG